MIKRIFLILCSVLLAGQCWAASYYARADGTAANKAAATGPVTDATACMSMATVNGETFSDLDIVYFSSQGGNYSTAFTPPSSGSDVDNKITYTNASGETPSINITGGNVSININGKSFITVNGFSVAPTAADTTNYNKAVGLSNACDNVTISNMTVDMSIATGATRYVLTSSGASTNVTLSNITGSGTTGDSYYFYGASSTDLVISTITNTGGLNAFRITNMDNVTISNITVTSPTQHGVYIYSCTGLIDIDTGTITSPTSSSVYLVDSTFDDGSEILNISTSGVSVQPSFYTDNVDYMIFTGCTSLGFGFGFRDINNSTNIDYVNCISDGATVIGFWVEDGGSAYTYINCIAKNGDSDGFGVTETVSDVLYVGCLSASNGDPESTVNGDGFTAHNTNSDIKYYFNVAYGNTCSGWALVGESTGVMYYNTSIGNGTGTDQIRAEIYLALTGGAGWTITNNIVYNTDSYELYNITDGSYVTADYNHYYSDLDDPYKENSLSLNHTEWVSAVGNETNTLTTDPIISSTGKIGPTSGSIDTASLIDTVYNAGYKDPFGHQVLGLPNRGADQNRSTYNKQTGNGTILNFGGRSLRPHNK